MCKVHAKYFPRVFLNEKIAFVVSFQPWKLNICKFSNYIDNQSIKVHLNLNRDSEFIHTNLEKFFILNHQILKHPSKYFP